MRKWITQVFASFSIFFIFIFSKKKKRKERRKKKEERRKKKEERRKKEGRRKKKEFSLLTPHIISLGIAVMIVGSYFPLLYYFFYCDEFWMVFYMSLVACLGKTLSLKSFKFFTCLSPKSKNQKKKKKKTQFPHPNFVLFSFPLPPPPPPPLFLPLPSPPTLPRCCHPPCLLVTMVRATPICPPSCFDFYFFGFDLHGDDSSFFVFGSDSLWVSFEDGVYGVDLCLWGGLFFFYFILFYFIYYYYYYYYYYYFILYYFILFYFILFDLI